MVTEHSMTVSQAGCTMRAYLHRLPASLALTHLDCQGCNRLFHLHHATLSLPTCVSYRQSGKGGLLQPADSLNPPETVARVLLLLRMSFARMGLLCKQLAVLLFDMTTDFSFQHIQCMNAGFSVDVLTAQKNV